MKKIIKSIYFNKLNANKLIARIDELDASSSVGEWNSIKTDDDGTLSSLLHYICRMFKFISQEIFFDKLTDKHTNNPTNALSQNVRDLHEEIVEFVVILVVPHKPIYIEILGKDITQRRGDNYNVFNELVQNITYVVDFAKAIHHNKEGDSKTKIKHISYKLLCRQIRLGDFAATNSIPSGSPQIPSENLEMADLFNDLQLQWIILKTWNLQYFHRDVFNRIVGEHVNGPELDLHEINAFRDSLFDVFKLEIPELYSSLRLEDHKGDEYDAQKAQVYTEDTHKPKSQTSPHSP